MWPDDALPDAGDASEEPIGEASGEAANPGAEGNDVGGEDPSKLTEGLEDLIAQANASIGATPGLLEEAEDADEVSKQWAAMLAEQQAKGGASAQSSWSGGSEVKPLAFPQIEGSGSSSDRGSIDLLLDVKLPIAVELGRTDMPIREIMEYCPGTVIELNKMAGDLVDILVNGRLVAQGEVVVVDEHFGVRITHLVSPSDRVKSLA